MPGGVGGSFQPTNPSLPISSFGAPSNFSAGASTQAGDYDTIMKNYGNLVSSATNNPITPTPVSPTNIAPTTTPYTQSSDVTGSLADLSNLATTGGYTAQGKADILARDVSPTRGIYANAQQNVDRQRALGGGYSPNFNAAQASMARDESNQVSGIDTAANAGIAQNVAANEIAASGTYAGAAGAANATKLQADQANTNIVNQINEDNANRTQGANTGNVDRSMAAQFQNRGQTQAAIQGQQSLYGTTPALTNTFGNQVVQAGQMGQGQQQIDEQKQRDVYGMASGGW